MKVTPANSRAVVVGWVTPRPRIGARDKEERSRPRPAVRQSLVKVLAAKPGMPGGVINDRVVIHGLGYLGFAWRGGYCMGSGCDECRLSIGAALSKSPAAIASSMAKA